ncbi:hypothetical protein M758_6G013100 [Ceratodon purpureus]|uniref:Uncharacterized protein n=1 Tax=Ceratodon purpureus TaxID=3225 RepID=A0A8T0HAR8_CERPU|nr:hypothetical protein KC19_6G014900 [Ceratodon purpureus]KAG0612249.1 hypothetical protein M758_6G013100 [Ceratodon purpureus]
MGRITMPALTSDPGAYKCKGLPDSGILVSEIRDEVPVSVVCKYFGSKSSKSGWKYKERTTPEQQAAILSLYQRVYEVEDIPNKEITLGFAKGLILMSRGEKVNWKQFSDARIEYRESLKRKRKENRSELKRGRECEVSEIATRVGSRRCLAPSLGFFSQSLNLTMKSEEMVVPAMGSKGGEGRVRVGPCWERHEVESMVAIIQNSANFVAVLKVLVEESQREKVSLEGKLRRAKMLLSDRQMMLDDSAAEVAKYVEELQSRMP